MKKYHCKHCKNSSEKIGVVQKETRYYSLNLETNQMEDFHGDESVELQEFFCSNCNENISLN